MKSSSRLSPWLRRTPIITLVLLWTAIVFRVPAATDIEFGSALSDSEAEALTRQLGVSLFGSTLVPAEGLGAAHVEIFVAGTGSKIESGASYWRAASGGDERSTYLVLPRAGARVGLPLGIDIGASYAEEPGTNVEAAGAELKWAFVRGSSAVPAVAVRLAHSRLRGVDQMDLDATSLALSVSKGLAILTPYGGVGRLWLSSEIHDIPGDPDFRLRSSPSLTQVFVGARLSAGWFKTYLEAERSGGIESYSLKLAVSVP